MRDRIARGVYMVGGSGLSADGDAAIYLVEGEAESVLIDAGTGLDVEAVLGNIERSGVDPGAVKRLILTHCHVDHSGGIPGLKERLGLTVVCHERCAEILARADDPRTAAAWYGLRLPAMSIEMPFSGDEFRLGLGRGEELVCLFTPGHSPGSICVYLDRDGERILFGQDVHGPLHPVLGSNRDDYQQSLRKLLALKADVLCEGHYGVFRPAAEVEKFIRSFL